MSMPRAEQTVIEIITDSHGARPNLDKPNHKTYDPTIIISP